MRSKVLADYWALTKPEVNFLILITTFAGFCLARPVESYDFPFLLLVHTLVGMLLVASGAGALNQFVERRFDTHMRRTARRPLASGRLEPVAVLWFGILLSCAGGIYLAMVVNALASLLAALTLLSYLFLYTPRKRRTPLCTLVGAFPGAMPPLIGWAAASGRLSFEAWVLFSMLFLWQFPALHGHCMDVSRGLRAGGLSGSSSREAKNSFHGLAEHASGSRFDSCQSCPRAHRACRSGLHGGSFAPGLALLLLWRTIGQTVMHVDFFSPRLFYLPFVFILMVHKKT